MNNIVSTGKMMAQSISIQVSSRSKCNAGCKFCISQTTPHEDEQRLSDLKFCAENRLHVGFNYARVLGATHAILTGQADPTQEDIYYLCNIIKIARKYLPLVDFHTNGFLISRKNNNMLSHLVHSGLTMITFSIASFLQEINVDLMGINVDPKIVIQKAVEQELLVRCSLVVTKSSIDDFEKIMNYIYYAGELGAHMVVIREIWVPEVYSEFNRSVFEWNKANFINTDSIQERFLLETQNPNNKWGLKLRDPLPWGTPVFVAGGMFKNENHGVNITFARCSENSRNPVMKSIVHKPNGHGYRNWDHNGDILY